MVKLVSHLTRQAAVSRATFGPGTRTKGVIDHISKELEEIEECYEGEVADHVKHSDASKEWVDVVILGWDGLLRAIWAANTSMTADQVAKMASEMLVAKQAKNEMRNWPDWRTADPDKAIEHVKGIHD